MDARIARTRHRLQQALFALARERGLEEISISDIAERAGVNRTTFYQHYSDKETLLADALESAAAAAGADLEGLDAWTTEPPPALVTFLEHIEANAALYRRVFAEHGSAAVIARLRARLVAVVGDIAGSQGELPKGVPVDVIAAGVAGSVVGIIGAWLNRDEPVPAAVAARWVCGVVAGPAADNGAGPGAPVARTMDTQLHRG